MRATIRPSKSVEWPVQRAAGLIDQRQIGKARDPLVRRDVTIDVAAERIGVGAAEWTRPEAAVGQPRSMRQQIVDRDLPVGRYRAVERPGRRPQHAHRRPSRDRIVERDPPLLEQHQRGNRRDRLRHRRDAENRVGFDRKSGVQVAGAGASRMSGAVAPERQRGARETARGHDSRDGLNGGSNWSDVDVCHKIYVYYLIIKI
jgi:hypothetical protein